MALERVLSFSERAAMLGSLAALNSKASKVYEQALSDGYLESEAYVAAYTILQEAEDIAANLSWYPETKVVVDSANGVTAFTAGAAPKIFYARDGSAYAACSVFYAFGSADVIKIRSCEYDQVNGEYTIVTPATSSYNYRIEVTGDATVSGLAGVVAGSTEIEFILYKKSV